MNTTNELIEEWMPIYPDCLQYAISNYGRVASLHNGIYYEILKQQTVKRTGYKYVVLDLTNKSLHLIHRLVSLAFIVNPDPSRYKFVNHLDENKENNCALNLEWTSCSENLNWGTCCRRISEKHRRYAKLTNIVTGEFYVFKGTDSILKFLNLPDTRTSVVNMLLRQNLTRYGYLFERITEQEAEELKPGISNRFVPKLYEQHRIFVTQNQIRKGFTIEQMLEMAKPKLPDLIAIDEIWKLHPRSANFYYASSYGRIFSLHRQKGELLQTSRDSSPLEGPEVTVILNGKRERISIARMVMETFGEMKSEEYVIAHINCDKIDNRFENLKWIKYSDYMSLDEILRTNRNVSGIRVAQFSLTGEFIAVYVSCRSAAQATGFAETKINDAVVTQNPRCHVFHGYVWDKYTPESVNGIDVVKLGYVVSSKPETDKWKPTPIVAIDPNTRTIHKIYKSIGEAARDMTGKSYGSVIRSCGLGITKSAYGFYWWFLEDLIDLDEIPCYELSDNDSSSNAYGG